ncbi:MAG: hypothetical protein AB1898_23845 [Acidobacteriota bacterium]
MRELVPRDFARMEAVGTWDDWGQPLNIDSAAKPLILGMGQLVATITALFAVVVGIWSACCKIAIKMHKEGQLIVRKYGTLIRSFGVNVWEKAFHTRDRPPRRVCRRTVCLVLGLFLLVRSARGAEILSVCHVFENLNRYQNKVIAVRSQVHRSSHGAWLWSKDCPGSAKMTFFGTTAMIHLALPEDEVDGFPRVKFAIKPEGFNQLEKIMAVAENRNVKVTATFEGLLRIVRVFKPVGTLKSGYHANGFGHVGMFPAQLVIKDIKEVAIE